jgi:hypothetical protein
MAGARSDVGAEVSRRASSSGQRRPAHGAASARTSAGRGARAGGDSLRMERRGHGPPGDLGAELGRGVGSRLAQYSIEERGNAFLHLLSARMQIASPF